MSPGERTQSQFDAPYICRPRGQNSQRGFGPNQAIDDVPNCSITAHREDRVFFLSRSLFCQFDDVFATLSFCRVHFPSSRFQLLYSRLNKWLYRKTSCGGVINDDGTAHARIIPEARPHPASPFSDELQSENGGGAA